MFNSIGERFNYFTSLLINKIRKMVKAKQQEATELDLIFVGSTLSCIVVTLGTAAFSHYEGNTILCSTTIIVMPMGKHNRAWACPFQSDNFPNGHALIVFDNRNSTYF